MKTHPHTHKEEFPDTQRLSEKANRDKREADGYLPQKSLKEEPRSWEEEFTQTFAEYANHERLESPAYILWVTNFISSLLSTREKEVREETIGDIERWGRSRMKNFEQSELSGKIEDMKHHLLTPKTEIR